MSTLCGINENLQEENVSINPDLAVLTAAVPHATALPVLHRLFDNFPCRVSTRCIFEWKRAHNRWLDILLSRPGRVVMTRKQLRDIVYTLATIPDKTDSALLSAMCNPGDAQNMALMLGRAEYDGALSRRGDYDPNVLLEDFRELGIEKDVLWACVVNNRFKIFSDSNEGYHRLDLEIFDVGVSAKAECRWVRFFDKPREELRDYILQATLHIRPCPESRLTNALSEELRQIAEDASQPLKVRESAMTTYLLGIPGVFCVWDRWSWTPSRVNDIIASTNPI
jgi:hypothetical protein